MKSVYQSRTFNSGTAHPFHIRTYILPILIPFHLPDLPLLFSIAHVNTSSLALKERPYVTKYCFDFVVDFAVVWGRLSLRHQERPESHRYHCYSKSYPRDYQAARYSSSGQ